GDGEEARKRYQRVVGTRQRGEMLLVAVADPKAAAASYAREGERFTAAFKNRNRGPIPAPPPGKLPEPVVPTDDLAALLFLGTLSHGDQTDVPGEKESAIIHVLLDALTGEMKKPFGKLYAAWTEPRPQMWQAGLFRALNDN